MLVVLSYQNLKKKSCSDFKVCPKMNFRSEMDTKIYLYLRKNNYRENAMVSSNEYD